MFETITIEGNKVSFWVDADNSVEFTVNGSCDKEERKGKVAITKWLISMFELAKNKYPYLSAPVHRGDGYGNTRESIYIRLGFVKDPSLVRLVWVSSKITLEEAVAQLIEVEESLNSYIY